MHPWSLLKDDGSASPILHVHRARSQSVLVHHAYVVEVGEGRSFLHESEHGRVKHQEPAVLIASGPTVGEHVHERVLVDIVVTFAQSFGAVLFRCSETIARLTAQPHELVTGQLHL